MESFRPVEALRTRVKEIRALESSVGSTTVMPGAAAVLGVQFRGRVRGPEGLLALAGVTGLQHGPRRYEYEPHTASVLVTFTPQGAACLGAPASQLAKTATTSAAATGTGSGECRTSGDPRPTTAPGR